MVYVFPKPTAKERMNRKCGCCSSNSLTQRKGVSLGPCLVGFIVVFFYYVSCSLLLQLTSHFPQQLLINKPSSHIYNISQTVNMFVFARRVNKNKKLSVGNVLVLNRFHTFEAWDHLGVTNQWKAKNTGYQTQTGTWKTQSQLSLKHSHARPPVKVTLRRSRPK